MLIDSFIEKSHSASLIDVPYGAKRSIEWFLILVVRFIVTVHRKIERLYYSKGFTITCLVLLPHHSLNGNVASTCNGSSASLRMRGASPTVEMVMWRAPMPNSVFMRRIAVMTFSCWHHHHVAQALPVLALFRGEPLHLCPRRHDTRGEGGGDGVVWRRK